MKSICYDSQRLVHGLICKSLLFPWLSKVQGALTEKRQPLVTTLEIACIRIHVFLPWLSWSTDVTYMSCVTYMSRGVWVLTANQMMIWGT